MGVLVKKENPSGTSFDPSGSQSRNQGGVNFIKTEEIVDEKKTKIHNAISLISLVVRRLHTSSRNQLKVVPSLEKVGEV